jgi:cytochrome c biogenesis protein
MRKPFLAMNLHTMRSRIWKFLCSLKLAVFLASAATLLTMGGSLVMHYNPRVFGGMDAMILGDWLAAVGRRNAGLAWWLPAAGLCIFLLGVNTLCCFLDWLRHLRARWRKTGEYLIHLGFVLVLAAYLWGSQAGFRSEGNRLLVGQTLPLEAMPGYALRLDVFEPVFNKAGRPIDMHSTVALLKDDGVVARQVVKTNTPLTYRGLVVVPGSFGRVAEGFNFFLSGRGNVSLSPGTRIPLDGGGMLRVVDFFPHAARRADGNVVPRGENLGNPAIELELLLPDREPWRGWYFLRETLPFPLVQAGVRLWPTEPVYRPFSVLTVNRDPGAGIALIGSLAMLAGVLFAMGSFYYKRARGDRPDIL